MVNPVLILVPGNLTLTKETDTMAIYATEARAHLYRKVEEELQGLFTKIEAAVGERQTSLIYDDILDELHLGYLNHLGYGVRGISWAASTNPVKITDATSYEITW